MKLLFALLAALAFSCSAAGVRTQEDVAAFNDYVIQTFICMHESHTMSLRNGLRDRKQIVEVSMVLCSSGIINFLAATGDSKEDATSKTKRLSNAILNKFQQATH